MATITTRRNQDGSIRYTAQIRLRLHGRIVSESQSFDRKRDAENWARRREVELKASGPPLSTVTLGSLIERYLKEFAGGPRFGRSKQDEIKHLLKWPIVDHKISELTVDVYIAHIEQRRTRGIQPQSVANDLIWIKQVLLTARSLWRIDVRLTELDDARIRLKHLGWIRKSRQRNRRPTSAELDQLYRYYETDRKKLLPMTDLIRFAIASCRRVDEITKLRWDDLNIDKKICMLRDLKHPTDKEGNDAWFRLTPEGLALILKQPRTSELIFPYNSKSISSSFQKACKILGIEDLHFHDLRREAISRLFEKGYAIHEVALFSLHRSWQTLQIYTKLKPEDIIDR